MYNDASLIGVAVLNLLFHCRKKSFKERKVAVNLFLWRRPKVDNHLKVLKDFNCNQQQPIFVINGKQKLDKEVRIILRHEIHRNLL